MGSTNHQKRKRKPISYLFIIAAILLAAEVLALIWLVLSVNRFQSFWQNKAKEPGEITYLALGDSAAQGIGASSPMRGYVGLVAKKLEAKTGKTVRIVNLSVTGATIRDCLNAQIPQIKSIKADYVTIEIGANDVKTFEKQKFTNDFGELLSKLPKGTYVSNMPLFNSRPSSTAPAKEASKVIEDLLQKNGKMRFVDLQKQTIDHQSIFGFAPDLFHPNNLSYKNWYQAFWSEMEKTTDQRLNY